MQLVVAGSLKAVCVSKKHVASCKRNGNRLHSGLPVRRARALPTMGTPAAKLSSPSVALFVQLPHHGPLVPISTQAASN